ncbi:Cytochrome P450 4d2 [Phlyctochytrium planicorne]|nr:Cytochrome P450 4d2 [Phlyctochytrium planicorne]
MLPNLALALKAGSSALAVIYALDLLLPLPEIRIYPGLETTASLVHYTNESTEHESSETDLQPHPKPAERPKLTSLQQARMILRYITQRIGGALNLTIPGPYCFPLVGNLFLLLPPVQQRKIHLVNRNLREEYGIISRIGGVGKGDVVLISDAEAAKFILSGGKHGEFIRSGFLQEFTFDIFKHGLFIMPTDDVWKKHRKFMTAGFGPPHLRHALEITNLVVEQLGELWTSTHSSPFVTDIFHVASCITLDVIGHVAFSYSFNTVLNHASPSSLTQMKAYQRAFDAVTARLGAPKFIWRSNGVHPDQIRGDVEIMKSVIRETIAARRNGNKNDNRQTALDEGMKGRDVLDRMLGAEDWKDEEITDEVIALFLAGGETTANTIVFCVYILSSHPTVLVQMREEIALLLPSASTPLTSALLSSFKITESIIREVLRLEPTLIAGISREVVAPGGVTLLGHHLCKGTLVNVDFRSLHRDARYWAHPNAFMPSRWLDVEGNFITPVPGSYLPFADGPHMCLGNKMAMVELKSVLIGLYRNFNLKVLPNQVFDVVTTGSHGFKRGLKVQVSKRQDLNE